MEDGQIRARLDKKFFQAADSSYIAGKFYDMDAKTSFVGAGNLPEANEGTIYTLNGMFTKHPKYGNQFKIISGLACLPDTKDKVIQFLSGSAFPTIGRKTAEDIYEALGDNCLELISNDTSILDDLPFLNSKKKGIIKDGLKSYGSYSSSYVKLVQLGLNDHAIELLTKEYPDPYQVLEKDCFKPYYEVYGFGYKNTMALADSMKVEADDPKRLEASIYEQIRNSTFQTGSTYMTIDKLYDKFLTTPVPIFEKALSSLEERGVIVRQDAKIYPDVLYEDELTITDKLFEHIFPVKKPNQDLEKLIQQVEFAYNIQYDAKQVEGIKTFFENSCFILNGGPGTGKSTTVRGLLNLISKVYPELNVQLCAPTGRAAKRLAQLSNTESRTIHSLLAWNKDDNTFGKNELEPLEADVVIVDEFSMVDTHLFASLLLAMKKGSRLVLIGDEDQLESVSPGKVFADLIQADIVPVIRLEKIFRQSEGSGIVSLAKEIRTEEPLVFDCGVEFEEKDGDEILDVIARKCQDYDSSQDLQVLAPMYKGTAGIDAINSMMQQLFNPKDKDRQEMHVSSKTFREGDKVMLLKNLPDQNVFNGDIGEILEIKPKGPEITVDFDGEIVSFENDFLYYLTLAYCTSIHKSQGSEYPNVILAFDGTSKRMMNKKLIYTGVSRAKKELLILGNRNDFIDKCRVRPFQRRKTTLKEFLVQRKKEV